MFKENEVKIYINNGINQVVYSSEDQNTKISTVPETNAVGYNLSVHKDHLEGLIRILCQVNSFVNKT